MGLYNKINYKVFHNFDLHIDCEIDLTAPTNKTILDNMVGGANQIVKSNVGNTIKSQVCMVSGDELFSSISTTKDLGSGNLIGPGDLIKENIANDLVKYFSANGIVKKFDYKIK